MSETKKTGEGRKQDTGSSGETRFRLSLTSLILLTTSVIAIVAWGVRLELRTSPNAIVEIVDTRLQGHPALLPAGSIIAYVGRGMPTLPGWAICGTGSESFPNLSGRFLVGTADLTIVGETTGERYHKHNFDVTSEEQSEARYRDPPPELADNHPTGRNWAHKHKVIGETKDTNHIPPSVHVLFFCKQSSSE